MEHALIRGTDYALFVISDSVQEANHLSVNLLGVVWEESQWQRFYGKIALVGYQQIWFSSDGGSYYKIRNNLLKESNRLTYQHFKNFDSMKKPCTSCRSVQG